MNDSVLVYYLQSEDFDDVEMYLSNNGDDIYKENDLVIAENRKGERDIASIRKKELYPIKYLPFKIENMKKIYKKFDIKNDFSKYITNKYKFEYHILSKEELSEFYERYRLVDYNDFEMEFQRAKTFFQTPSREFLFHTSTFMPFLLSMSVPQNYSCMIKTIYMEERNYDSIDQLLSDIQILLAQLIYEGRFIQRNLQDCISLFKEAAKANTAAAYTGLAYLYLENNNFNELTKAFTNFNKAAALGDLNAIYKLGDLYRYGIGVEKDMKMASDLYLRAYEADYEKFISFYNVNPPILYRAGDIYYYGLNKPVDYYTAFYFYNTAYRELYLSRYRIKNRQELIDNLKKKINLCQAQLDKKYFL